MFPRTLVFVEPGAQVTLIETFDGPAGLDYQVNTALELSIGDGAQVERIKIGREGAAALHISTVTAAIGAQAHYGDFAFTTGSAGHAQSALPALRGRGFEGAHRRRQPHQGSPARPTPTLVVDHCGAGVRKPRGVQVGARRC